MRIACKAVSVYFLSAFCVTFHMPLEAKNNTKQEKNDDKKDLGPTRGRSIA